MHPFSFGQAKVCGRMLGLRKPYTAYVKQHNIIKYSNFVEPAMI